MKEGLRGGGQGSVRTARNGSTQTRQGAAAQAKAVGLVSLSGLLT